MGVVRGKSHSECVPPLLDARLDTVSIDLSDIITLTQRAARGNESFDRECARTDTDRYVGDRIGKNVVEEIAFPAEAVRVLPAYRRFGAIQMLGLELGVRLRDVVADAERTMQLVQRGL